MIEPKNDLAKAGLGALIGIGAIVEAVHLGEVIWSHIAGSHSVWDCLQMLTQTDDATRIGLVASALLIWRVVRNFL